VDGREYERCIEQAMRDASAGYLVKISKPFYIGKHEVTQQQWEKVMGKNPSHHRGPGTERNPVDSVTWQDAQTFIRKLNALERTTAYRLPTEAEWEYAARAGRTGERIPDLGKSVWLQSSSGGRTHPVGEQPANAFGLFDTYGNVWEWCQDWYATESNREPAIDPRGPASGKMHVLKGGGALSHDMNLRMQVRAGRIGTDLDVGFRVVKVIAP
jgi:formylglycine-generating enzyme required for sulfatase activity